MRFALTPEQETLRDTARRFLAERVHVREQLALPGAHDPDLWQAIARMGWLDGDGMTFVETALLAEETGRALLPGPFLSTLILSQAVPASGPAPGAVALDPGALRLVRNRLRGEAIIACAEAAEVFLVIVRAGSSEALFLVRASESKIEPLSGADLTRPIARVRFEGSRIEQRLDPEITEDVRDRARVLVAADAVGGAAKTLETAVAYAKERIQFDRPIGSFQAVKHRAADAWRSVETARLAVWYAAWSIASGAEDATTAACAAKASAGDAFVRAAADSIQIHGGIGFTWEHDAHFYYRRALADQAMLGDAAEHREVIAAGVLARL